MTYEYKWELEQEEYDILDKKEREEAYAELHGAYRALRMNDQLVEALEEARGMLHTAQYMAQNVANGYKCEVSTDIKDLAALEEKTQELLKQAKEG